MRDQEKIQPREGRQQSPTCGRPPPGTWSSPPQFTVISCVPKDGSEGSRCGWPHQESETCQWGGRPSPVPLFLQGGEVPCSLGCRPLPLQSHPSCFCRNGSRTREPSTEQDLGFPSPLCRVWRHPYDVTVAPQSRGVTVGHWLLLQVSPRAKASGSLLFPPGLPSPVPNVLDPRTPELWPVWACCSPPSLCLGEGLPGRHI